jgi:hypothetical protein
VVPGGAGPLAIAVNFTETAAFSSFGLISPGFRFVGPLILFIQGGLFITQRSLRVHGIDTVLDIGPGLF